MEASESSKIKLPVRRQVLGMAEQHTGPSATLHTRGGGEQLWDEHGDQRSLIAVITFQKIRDPFIMWYV